MIRGLLRLCKITLCDKMKIKNKNTLLNDSLSTVGKYHYCLYECYCNYSERSFLLSKDKEETMKTHSIFIIKNLNFLITNRD